MEEQHEEDAAQAEPIGEAAEEAEAGQEPPVPVQTRHGLTNPAKVGIASEMHVRTRLIERGYEVYVPLGHATRSDLVYEDFETGKLVRVQVKTGAMYNGCVTFRVCSTNGFTGERRSYHGQVEEFMVWCPTTRKVYRMKIGEVGRNEVRLRVDTPRGGSKSTIRWAKDYEF